MVDQEGEIRVTSEEIQQNMAREALNHLRQADGKMGGQPYKASVFHPLRGDQRSMAGDNEIGFSLSVTGASLDEHSLKAEDEPVEVPLVMNRDMAGVIVMQLLDQGALTQQEVNIYFEQKDRDSQK